MFKFPAPNSNLRVVATSLGINLKTAKALSLNIPDKRLALADEVLARSILSATNGGKWCSDCCRGATHSSDYYLVCSRPVRHSEHHSKRRRKPLGSASRILVLG